MRDIYVLGLVLLFSFSMPSAQIIEDDFEGTGTITTWYGDNCGMDNNFANPFQTGINTSNTVLQYNDTGAQYANVRFDSPSNFDLTTKNTFTLKIYVPSVSVTGSQPNQISLKLQDGTLAQPWVTQSEIIKSIQLDQWQEVSFNFEEDTYINLDGASPPPIERTDFNRVVIQVNSENNNDLVIAYLDDVLYHDTVNTDPVYDNLVWSDEFNGSGALDATKWYHQTQFPQGTSWFNGEIQHYTDRTDNSNMSGGHLNLVAKKETYTDQGVTKLYTSARLNSKFAFTYGRVEIRAKLPIGVGTWPALWMLGKNITENGAYWETQGFGTTGWPACGEIDIMEHWGDNQNFVQSAMHTPSSFGNTANKGGQIVSTASSQFHTYTLDWFPDRMVFKVDGATHYVYEPETQNSDTWPFDEDQYLLFNVAMLPNVQASFTESTMEVDYVRVYQESTLNVNDSIVTLNAELFPNPVKDNLTIKLPQEALGARVTLISLLGQEMTSYIQNETLQYINMSNYKSGVYIVKIENNNTVLTHKIVKK